MVVTSQYRSPLSFSVDTLEGASNSLTRIDKLIGNLNSWLVTLEGLEGGEGGSRESYAKDRSNGNKENNNQNNENDNKNNNENNDMLNKFNLKVSDYLLIKDKEFKTSIISALNLFETSMCDDMNTPRAASALFLLVNLGEKELKLNILNKTQINLLLTAIKKIDEIFGVLYEVPSAYFPKENKSSIKSKVPLEIDMIPEEIVQLARKRLEFKTLKLYSEADALRGEIEGLGYDMRDKKGGYDIYKL